MAGALHTVKRFGVRGDFLPVGNKSNYGTGSATPAHTNRCNKKKKFHVQYCRRARVKVSREPACTQGSRIYFFPGHYERAFFADAAAKKQAFRFKSSEAPMRFLWAFRYNPLRNGSL
jgi:hypothetical protein